MRKIRLSLYRINVPSSQHVLVSSKSKTLYTLLINYSPLHLQQPIDSCTVYTQLLTTDLSFSILPCSRTVISNENKRFKR